MKLRIRRCAQTSWITVRTAAADAIVATQSRAAAIRQVRVPIECLQAVVVREDHAVPLAVEIPARTNSERRAAVARGQASTKPAPPFAGGRGSTQKSPKLGLPSAACGVYVHMHTSGATDASTAVCSSIPVGGAAAADKPSDTQDTQSGT